MNVTDCTCAAVIFIKHKNTYFRLTQKYQPNSNSLSPSIIFPLSLPPLPLIPHPPPLSLICPISLPLPLSFSVFSHSVAPFIPPSPRSSPYSSCSSFLPFLLLSLFLFHTFSYLPSLFRPPSFPSFLPLSVPPSLPISLNLSFLLFSHSSSLTQSLSLSFSLFFYSSLPLSLILSLSQVGA